MINVFILTLYFDEFFLLIDLYDVMEILNRLNFGELKCSII